MSNMDTLTIILLVIAMICNIALIGSAFYGLYIYSQLNVLQEEILGRAGLKREKSRSRRKLKLTESELLQIAEKLAVLAVLDEV